MNEIFLCNYVIKARFYIYASVNHVKPSRHLLIIYHILDNEILLINLYFSMYNKNFNILPSEIIFNFLY